MPSVFGMIHGAEGFARMSRIPFIIHNFASLKQLQCDFVKLRRTERSPCPGLPGLFMLWVAFVDQRHNVLVLPDFVVMYFQVVMICHVVDNI